MRQRIDRLVDIQIGYQFRERLTMAVDGTHQVIQVKDIDELNEHKLLASSLYRVTPKTDPSKHEVADGDVIFLSKGRRNSATLVTGLRCELPVLRPDGRQETVRVPTIAAGYFFILRPRAEGIRPEYLTWAINSRPAQEYLQSVSSGSAMPFISKQAFMALEIDVPSPETQERIVKLYGLAQHESFLLGQLEKRRSELVNGICLVAARQNNG